MWKVSVILGNLKSSGRAKQLSWGRSPPSPWGEADSSAIVSGSKQRGKSFFSLEPGWGIRSWNYRERHSWSITGATRGAMATLEAPSSPVHLSLCKNQARVAISVRFDYPQGHKAGACLVCRAMSCFKCLPSLPRAGILWFHPWELKFPSCWWDGEVWLKTILVF